MTTPPRLAIYDDGRGRFGPLTDLRPIFRLRTATHNNRVRMETTLGIMAADLLAPRHAEVESDAWVNQPLRRDASVTFHVRRKGGSWGPVQQPGDAPVLLVNGRWSGAGEQIDAIRALQVGEAIVQADNQVVAAHLTVDDAQAFADGGYDTLPDAAKSQRVDAIELIERPWDVLNALPQLLAFDIEHIHRDGVHRTAKVHPSAVVVEDAGPVCIGANVSVGALAVLEGPCHIGRNSVVAAHAHIRPNTCIGETCKMGGEIGASIINDYSNKAHAGYLGDAIVGSWVNLGADTNVSNLKNTYGNVRVQLDADGAAEDTGRAFQGPIIGDFVKTAIGTRLLTGSCIGAGSMLALSTFAPKFVPPLRFMTDGGDVPYEIESFLGACRKMMSRRSVELSDALEQQIRGLSR